MPLTSLNKLLLAASAASFVLAGPVLASSGLVCEGEGGSASIAMGTLPILSVLGAHVELGETSYVTGPERGEGEPFIVGQAFGEGGSIWVDFVDPNVERILVSLRITMGEDYIWSGTLSGADQVVQVECMEG